jgi:hypothetical protein
MRRPYFEFEEQAAKRHPGHKPDQICARRRLTDDLWAEFHSLQLLLRKASRQNQGTSWPPMHGNGLSVMEAGRVFIT